MVNVRHARRQRTCGVMSDTRHCSHEGYSAVSEQGHTAVACSWCGTTADPVPITWTVQSSARGLEYLCETCTRDNVRKIEGSLPPEYW
jgi:hypothetical protein